MKLAKLAENKQMIKITIINKIVNPNGIQSGAVTHHQDQSITFVSFKTRKTTKSIVEREIPDDVLFVFIFLNFKLFLHNQNRNFLRNFKILIKIFLFFSNPC